MNLVTQYSDYISDDSLKLKARKLLRATIIQALSLNRKIRKNHAGISFPYYHHVFDDEIKGFDRQLKHFKNYGDFITIDQAYDLISENKPIKDRYFCLSFDDGFKNCYTNMMEVTDKYQAPVIIYLPTDYINLDLSKPKDVYKMENFEENLKKKVPFLDWNECREMLNHNVSFGSHTCQHVNLSTLNEEELTQELKVSKHIIEEELGVKCEHFAVPWGRRGVDFDEKILAKIAEENGYKTVVTTNRGLVTGDENPYLIKRDHVIANWSNNQLNYFFGS